MALSSAIFSGPTFGYSRPSSSNALITAEAITMRANDLLSAGTTYQGDFAR